MKNSRFSFFLDIDKTEELNDDKLVYLLNDIIVKLKELIEDDSINYEYIVSKREEKYHINFPNIIIDNTLVNSIVKELQEIKEFCYVDTSVYKTGLRLIGSYKPNEEECYKLYDILEKKYISMTPELFKKCIVRKKSDDSLIKIKVEFLCKELSKNCSIQEKCYSGIELEISKLIDYFNDKTNEKYSMESFKYYDNSKIYNVSIIEKFCPFKNREHIRKGSPLYIQISAKGMVLKCYDIDCQDLKHPIENIKLPENMNSDYKSLYNILLKTDFGIGQDIKVFLEESLSGTHYKISQFIFNLYKDIFRVDDIKNSTWYFYNQGLHKWEKTFKLNILISEELPKHYNSLKVSIESSNISQNVENNLRNEQIKSIVNKLENVTFKDNIMKQLTILFKNHDPLFIQKLDSNPYLLGFNNGVYDFNSCTFRDGLNTDYITFTTNYNYIEYDNDNEYIKEIYNFFSQIIPNKNILTYLLKILGKALIGHPDEKFYILTGVSGANGKSTIISFLEMCLNDYMISADISLLTNKRNNSSNASPDLVRMKGVRCIAFQEPESNDQLKTGLLKQLTGSDSIIARALFKEPISFKLQATLLLCCNDLPSITGDGGVWRRLRIIDFNSRFVDNPVKPNEYKIDYNLKDKLKKWKPYFTSILLHYYNLYKIEGNNEPEEVLVATNRYKNENDKFTEFIDTQLNPSNNILTPYKQIYTYMVSWWSNNYPNMKIPDIKELKKSLKLKYGNEKDKYDKESGKMITGFSVVFIEEEETENDELPSDY